MSNWIGGDNFVKQQQWGSGKSNDGAGRRRQGLTKRGRFNPHHGPIGGPGCLISARAMRDKQKAANSPKIVKPFRSPLIKRLGEA